MTEADGVHPNVQAVLEAARRHDVELSVREFPQGTRTAADAASAVGVKVGQIVKSLVFELDGEPLLALVSGDNRLDETRLAKEAGGAAVSQARADIVRAATGYEIGGVPPFGHPTMLRTFLDEDLLRYEEVWAAAGTPRHVFAISPGTLQRLCDAKTVVLGRERDVG